MQDICKTYARHMQTSPLLTMRRGGGKEVESGTGPNGTCPFIEVATIFLLQKHVLAEAKLISKGIELARVPLALVRQAQAHGTGPNGTGPNGSCRPYLSHAPSIASRKTFTAAEPVAGTTGHRTIMMEGLPQSSFS